MVLFTDINAFYAALAMLPIAGAFIAPVAGLGSQLVGHFLNRKQRKATLENTRAQTTLARQQGKSAKALRGRQTQLHTQTQSITAQILPRLQALLSGDREALTQQVAPQLQQLTGSREAAAKRIDEGGGPGGANVQANLELEKANFAERSRLLAAAPQEAQAGMTQLLQLLFGAADSAGTGAAQASSIASSTLANIASSDTRNRLLNMETLSGITKTAAGFGKQLFASGGDISSLTAGDDAVPSLPNPGGLPGGNIGGSGSGGILGLLKGLLKR